MSHDVFISYSKPDKTKADAVCSLLERAGIRCWVAPRDILPGETWGGSIVRAIQSSRVMILVLSSNSNQSSHVVREVERAVNRGLPIIPFRIDSTEPTGDMEFFIGSRHWLDALDPPLERHIERLAQVVKRLLAAELPADRVDEELAAAAPEGPAPKEREPRAADRPSPKAAAAAGGGAAPPLPPRVEPAGRPGSAGAEPPAATTPGAPWRPLGLNPVVIAGIGAGGLLLIVLFIILLALALRNGEEGEPAAVPSPIPPDTTPTIPMGVPQSFVLNPGFSRYHVVSVAPGETRTATVLSDDFDAILEVMRQARRIDAYSAQPEEVVLDPGEWQIAVESYDDRTGSYQWDVYRGDQRLSSQSFAIEPDSRDLNSVSVVAGETKRVVASSTAFDIVLKVYEFEERVDRGIAGRPEEVVLDEPGDWEVNVKSYDQRAGDYTLTVRRRKRRMTRHRGTMVALVLLGMAACGRDTETTAGEQAPLVATCDDLGPGEAMPEFGCFNLGEARDLRFDESEVYWHIRAFPDRASAEAARSDTGVVVEADGGVWLTELGPRDLAIEGGEAVAVVGPLELPPASSYHAVVSYARMRPGDRSIVHTHSGPEGWYMLAGEQCLETQTGTHRAGAGETMTVEANVPMELSITGTELRRSLLVVVHDATRPRGAPSDWRPTGACARG